LQKRFVYAMLDVVAQPGRSKGETEMEVTDSVRQRYAGTGYWVTPFMS
jgi:hypothetical protein